MSNHAICGVIVVHLFNNISFRFVAREGEIYLLGENKFSDKAHQLSAQIIADARQVTVIWQDICGMKHYVRPGDEAKGGGSTIDPRDNYPSPNQSVC